MPDSQFADWKRVAVEGGAIIASILIAFAIDAWWSNTVERGEEREHLVALQSELKINIESIDFSLQFRRAVRNAASELLEISARDLEVSNAKLDQLLGSLVYWDFIQPATGAYQSLVEGGKLSLIQSHYIRTDIASLSTRYTHVERIEGQSYETFKNFLMPYLYENAIVGQLSNAQRESPGTGGGEQPPIPIGNPIDNRDLLADRKFVGILTNIYWDQNDAIGALDSLRTDLMGLTSKIESGLDQ